MSDLSPRVRQRSLCSRLGNPFGTVTNGTRNIFKGLDYVPGPALNLAQNASDIKAHQTKKGKVGAAQQYNHRHRGSVTGKYLCEEPTHYQQPSYEHDSQATHNESQCGS